MIILMPTDNIVEERLASVFCFFLPPFSPSYYISLSNRPLLNVSWFSSDSPSCSGDRWYTGSLLLSTVECAMDDQDRQKYVNTALLKKCRIEDTQKE
jgi:hypothetical protein